MSAFQTILPESRPSATTRLSSHWFHIVNEADADSASADGDFLAVVRQCRAQAV